MISHIVHLVSEQSMWGNTSTIVCKIHCRLLYLIMTLNASRVEILQKYPSSKTWADLKTVIFQKLKGINSKILTEVCQFIPYDVVYRK